MDHSDSLSARGVLVARTVLLAEHARRACSGSQRLAIYSRCIGCTHGVTIKACEIGSGGSQRRSIYLRCIACTYSFTIRACEKCLQWITTTAHLLEVCWWHLLRYSATIRACEQSLQWITATIYLLRLYWLHIQCYYQSMREVPAVDHSDGLSA